MIIKLAILLAILLIVTGFRRLGVPARPPPARQPRPTPPHPPAPCGCTPGEGFAHLFSLWLRSYRFAVLRRSGQIRPALPWRHSLLDPGEHWCSSAARTTGTGCASRWSTCSS